MLRASMLGLVIATAALLAVTHLDGGSGHAPAVAGDVAPCAGGAPAPGAACAAPPRAEESVPTPAADDPAGPGDSSNVWTIVIAVLAATAAFVLTGAAAYALLRSRP